MNAQQRRKAYRKIDQMVGKTVQYALPSGLTNTGTVVGRTDRVFNLSSTCDQSPFNGYRPSVHRVRVKLCSGAHQSPRLSVVEVLA